MEATSILVKEHFPGNELWPSEQVMQSNSHSHSSGLDITRVD